ncbi:hypothetical protein H9Q10_08225 [Eikenella sp. S3360]|uniref:Plasmid pRiA4b Orf3-like domain-containing protein n=1 Tax=Eikenella glucosivorans TaxID=2766967 RepID=A0ABS0NBI2_9NEIS|nr:hypothetical protein [Eikenella glucosivorans]MBH5329651.1 hypothetical protein [Eikenella glucosivorans]
MPATQPSKPTIYRFKVSLIGDHAQPVGKLHRILEISADAPFTALHGLIFDAFDRTDDHAFKFLLTRKEIDNEGELYDYPEEVSFPALYEDFPPPEGVTVHDAATYRIQDAGLQEKDCIYYWFDFGDDWMHRLRLEKIFQAGDDYPEEGYILEIAKKVGESPEQYPDYE